MLFFLAFLPPSTKPSWRCSFSCYPHVKATCFGTYSRRICPAVKTRQRSLCVVLPPCAVFSKSFCTFDVCTFCTYSVTDRLTFCFVCTRHKHITIPAHALCCQHDDCILLVTPVLSMTRTCMRIRRMPVNYNENFFFQFFTLIQFVPGRG